MMRCGLTAFEHSQDRHVVTALPRKRNSLEPFKDLGYLMLLQNSAHLSTTASFFLFVWKHFGFSKRKSFDTEQRGQG